MTNNPAILLDYVQQENVSGILLFTHYLQFGIYLENGIIVKEGRA